jgi:colicin import membrane protein
MKRLAVLIPAALLLLTPALYAEDTEPTPAADDTVTLRADADRLHDEAKEVRTVAETEFAKAQKECWNKFLVSKCLDDAGLTLRREKAKAASLDSRARAIERELKRREVAEKDAKRAEKEAAQSTRGKP